MLQNDLALLERWRESGTHYQRTAEAWLRNPDRARTEVLAILAGVHGAEAPARLAAWRTFCLACAELWGFRGGREWFVSHYLLRRR